MKPIDIISKRFAEIIEEKIKKNEVEGWSKGWIGGQFANPRNLRGTSYNNWNSFILSFYCEVSNFKTPIFLTFNQAKEENISIKKGEKSFPVVFWNLIFKHTETNKPIPQQEYDSLSKEEKDAYSVNYVLKYYNVFNLDQTTFEEVHNERYLKLVAEQEALKEIVVPNDFKCELLDKMIENNTWICRINERQGSDKAYFATSLADNFIHIPSRTQFEKQERFYGTLLHEMMHSTKLKVERSFKRGEFGTTNYAKEEIIAELGSAIVGSLLGINVIPTDDNISYIKSWLRTLKNNTEEIFILLGDINKGVKIFQENLNI